MISRLTHGHTSAHTSGHTQHARELENARQSHFDAICKLVDKRDPSTIPPRKR